MVSFSTPTHILHYYSDLSGDVIIVDRQTGQKMAVPASALCSFIALHVRQNLINRIEEFSDEAILFARFERSIEEN